MLHSPRRALAAGLLMLALSHVLFTDTGPARIPLADAARHEGQQVDVEGVVRSLRVRDGGARVTLVAAGHALEVYADGAEGLHLGAVVHASGRLTRLGPELVLLADRVTLSAPPPAPPTHLSALSRPDPPDHPVRVSGMVEGGELRADGTGLRLGEGPWPPSGRVTATVLAVFEPDCACTRLHAHAVRPWT